MDWAHLFGRRALIGEPWCSSPELTAGLCRDCHRAIDGNVDTDLRDRLRWDGITRFVEANGLPQALTRKSDPLDAIRAAERLLGERE